MSNVRTIELNSSYTMPMVGLGTWALNGQTCLKAIEAFIKAGGRLIDTASFYHNEAELGQAVKKAVAEGLVRRDELFVITKLYPNQFAHAHEAIEKAFESLGLEYLDMMLLHHPGRYDVEAYQEMERYVAQGKIKSLGLSNYYIKELSDFLPKVTLKPALVQNEIHPYYQDTQVVNFIQEQGIVVQAWYPLAGRGHRQELLNDKVIRAIAGELKVTPTQVVLRWHLQRHIVTIPASSNVSHIQENLDIFDFELSAEHMAAIAKLNRNEKYDWY